MDLAPAHTVVLFLGWLVDEVRFTVVNLEGPADTPPPRFAMDDLAYASYAHVVPEPGVLALMLAGLAGLVVIMRVRGRQVRS